MIKQSYLCSVSKKGKSREKALPMPFDHSALQEKQTWQTSMSISWDLVWCRHNTGQTRCCLCWPIGLYCQSHSFINRGSLSKRARNTRPQVRAYGDGDTDLSWKLRLEDTRYRFLKKLSGVIRSYLGTEVSSGQPVTIHVKTCSSTKDCACVCTCMGTCWRKKRGVGKKAPQAPQRLLQG